MSEYAEVHIRWFSSGESGRTTPIHLCAEGTKAYKPHFRVNSVGEYLGVALISGKPAIAHPGSDCEATIAIIYTDTGVDYKSLTPHAAFDVLEGARVIGRGFESEAVERRR